MRVHASLLGMAGRLLPGQQLRNAPADGLPTAPTVLLPGCARALQIGACWATPACMQYACGPLCTWMLPSSCPCFPLLGARQQGRRTADPIITKYGEYYIEMTHTQGGCAAVSTERQGGAQMLASNALVLAMVCIARLTQFARHLAQRASRLKRAARGSSLPCFAATDHLAAEEGEGTGRRHWRSLLLRKPAELLPWGVAKSCLASKRGRARPFAIPRRDGLVNVADSHSTTGTVNLAGWTARGRRRSSHAGDSRGDAAGRLV